MATPLSDELFSRASAVIPGGVNSPVRAFGSVGGTPRFFTRARGAHAWDEDGNEFIDLVQSWGPLPLGHAHPAVLAAARSALQAGSTFGAPTRGEAELAERIVDAVPSIEQVRLVSSGTEAAMSAVRLARGATGRAKILKFDGHYHGHSDALLAAAGSGVATLGIPGSPGVTPGAASDTIVLPWNDPDAVDAAIAEHADELAAIICEPIPANMNLVPPAPGFLQHLRDVATSTGALLIFDEVISGFRVGRGGAQAAYDIHADLTVLGKAIGGGFPLAAFGGRADVMAELAPVGPVYQAGTLSGNPVAVAAGIAQLDLLDPPTYRTLSDITAHVVEAISQPLRDAGVGVTCRRVRTLAGLLFANDAPMDRSGVAAADHDRYGAFFHAMLANGIYLAPSGWEVLFTCTALTEDDVAAIGRAAERAAEHIAGAVSFPDA
ncbi:MAG: glutamate-1-semialdehyde 2,1-aminomutase [Nitriliruptorales bacterium]|nr:glutamate-1-semialdehyde 2,1-aminomutase [Nitriliruptorales bacterium]